jgi:hypothetical protein
MLTLALEDLMLELEEGTIKHVGPKTAGATVKLYHVESAEARAFGDQQCKLAFADGEGNEVEIALGLDEAAALGTALQEGNGDG